MLLRIVALVCLASAAWGHGPLPERIEALDARIAKEPRSARLRVQRGELHRQNGEPELAEADYDAAARLEPGLAAVDLARARLLIDAGEPEQALEPLRRCLKKLPSLLEARRLLARVLTLVGREAEAAEAWALVTEARETLRPDDFLAQANNLVMVSRTAEAVARLDAGMRRLGPQPVLEQRAIEILLDNGGAEAALGRIESGFGRAARQEGWLELKARALTALGRREEAATSARAGLALIAALPGARRETNFVRELSLRLESFLPP